jgi:hypothetical protein
LSIGLYVDNFVYFSEDLAVEALFERLLQEHVKVNFMGLVEWFLGINFSWRITTSRVDVYLNKPVLLPIWSNNSVATPRRHWIGGKRGEIIVGNQHVAQWEMRTFLVIGEAEKIFLHSTRNRKLSLLLLLS